MSVLAKAPNYISKCVVMFTTQIYSVIDGKETRTNSNVRSWNLKIFFFFLKKIIQTNESIVIEVADLFRG